MRRLTASGLRMTFTVPLLVRDSAWAAVAWPWKVFHVTWLFLRDARQGLHPKDSAENGANE